MVEISLKYLQTFNSSVIGRARIPLNEIAAAGDNGYHKTLVLYDKYWNIREETNGELEVLIRWKFDAETDQLIAQYGKSMRKPSFGKQVSQFFKKVRADLHHQELNEALLKDNAAIQEVSALGI